VLAARDPTSAIVRSGDDIVRSLPWVEAVLMSQLGVQSNPTTRSPSEAGVVCRYQASPVNT